MASEPDDDTIYGKQPAPSRPGTEDVVKALVLVFVGARAGKLWFPSSRIDVPLLREAIHRVRAHDAVRKVIVGMEREYQLRPVVPKTVLADLLAILDGDPAMRWGRRAGRE